MSVEFLAIQGFIDPSMRAIPLHSNMDPDGKMGRWENCVSGTTTQQEASSSQPKSHSWILHSDPSSSQHVHLPISEDLLHRHDYKLVIGRKPGVAHLIIDNSSISKAHAILSFSKGNFAIIDKQSANGTSINGTDLNPGQRTRINSGDKLTLGEVTVTFSQTQ